MSPKKPRLATPRNKHATAAIMRKGGAHGPSKKAQRQQAKRQLRRAPESFPKAA